MLTSCVLPHNPNIYYQKCGVMLMDLVPEGGQQLDIFGYSDDNEKSHTLMATMDKINKKYSRGTVKLASEGVRKAWVMNREFKSPNYTGDWKELRIINVDARLKLTTCAR